MIRIKRFTLGFCAALAVSLMSSCTSTGPGLERLAQDIRVARPNFTETDPINFPGRGPAAYPVHGTDTSKYQPDVDWPVARANGVSFAFLKATEGGDRVDEAFAGNFTAAKTAGVPRGGYHFFYFCTPAFQQAAWFIRHVPKDPSALPPLLDMEWNHKSPSCKLRPDPATVRKEMQVWLDTVERHYGKKPLIYTVPDFYRENLEGHFTGYQFFLRAVADHPSNIYPGRKWTFWQYSGTGAIPGIKGGADMNVFNGSPAQWKAWLANR
jgi:lysozyme